MCLPSMSKTDLYLTCEWPWGREITPAPVGDDARYGSAFHQALGDDLAVRAGATTTYTSIYELAKKWGVNRSLRN